ncbi:MAG: hypothetical protein ACYC91_00955 [Solirubrobacteraceae bacterium]
MLLTALTTVAPVPHVPGHNYWWYVGLGIGFAIVVVVVIIAATILALAARIGAQAREAIDAMDQARATTLPVWQVQQTNVSLTAIWRAAEAAGKSLQGTTREALR